jgi:hypothetical protein
MDALAISKRHALSDRATSVARDEDVGAFRSEKSSGWKMKKYQVEK